MMLRLLHKSDSLRYALFLVLAVGCRAPFGSDAREAPAEDHPVKIMIPAADGSQFLFFGAPLETTTLRLCMGPNVPQCTDATPGSVSAVEVKTQNTSRKFFRTPEKVTVAADLQIALQYTVTPAVATKPRHVKFVASGQAPTGDTGSTTLAHALSLISRQELEANLTHLASPEYRGRDTGTPENERAAQWLIGKLKEYGVQPLSGQDYLQKFTARQRLPAPRETANILGVIPGNDPELKGRYVIIGAHMDHVGSRSCIGGGLCQGADDNGSGSVSVLNIAKALSAARSHLKRSVIIMFFSGEELGLLGSYHYVRNPVVPMAQVDYMINMDMVGYLREGRLDAGGALRNAEAAKMLEETLKKYPDIRPRLQRQYSADSDHAPFFEAGIAGLFFHTGLHENYHRAGDTPEPTKINYDGMTNIAKVSFEHLVDVANADQVANVGFSLLDLSTEPLHGHVHGDGEFSGCAKTLDW